MNQTVRASGQYSVEGSVFGSDSEKEMGIRAPPVIDVFPAKVQEKRKTYRVKETSYPIIRRENLQTTEKRSRGRPKLNASRRILPMIGIPKILHTHY